jgi:hypothetical protein
MLAKLPAALVALGVLAVLPLGARAEGICLHNKLQRAVFAQGASQVRNVIIKGQPVLIKPGLSGWDARLAAGKRRIMLFDAQTNRMIFWRDIDFMGDDLHFTIELDPQRGNIILTPKKNPQQKN